MRDKRINAHENVIVPICMDLLWSSLSGQTDITIIEIIVAAVYSSDRKWTYLRTYLQAIGTDHSLGLPLHPQGKRDKLPKEAWKSKPNKPRRITLLLNCK